MASYGQPVIRKTIEFYVRGAEKLITTRETYQINENGYDQTVKADKGKIRPTLVPLEAIEDIAETRGYGVAKYGDNESWAKVEIERYRDALFRHLIAYLRNPQGKDEESGIEHYKHLITNAAFICALERKAKDEKRM